MEVREAVVWRRAGYRPGCVFSCIHSPDQEILTFPMRFNQPFELMLHDISNAIVTLNSTIQLPLLQEAIHLTHR